MTLFLPRLGVGTKRAEGVRVCKLLALKEMRTFKPDPALRLGEKSN